MTATRKTKRFVDLRILSQVLGNLAASLPGQAEKDAVRLQLQALTTFLDELKQLVEAFPSPERARELQDAVTKLDGLLERAERTQILSAAKARSKATRRPSRSSGSVDVEQVRMFLADLEKLPADERRARLEDPVTTPPALLRALGERVGAPTTQRSTRSSLVQLVATRLENARGYESLRRGPEAPSKIEEPE